MSKQIWLALPPNITPLPNITLLGGITSPLYIRNNTNSRAKFTGQELKCITDHTSHHL